MTFLKMVCLVGFGNGFKMAFQVFSGKLWNGHSNGLGGHSFEMAIWMGCRWTLAGLTNGHTHGHLESGQTNGHRNGFLERLAECVKAAMWARADEEV